MWCFQESSHVQDHAVWLRLAYNQAVESQASGGIPIGAALVHIPSKEVISLGHNQRVQRGSNILHGEMDCFENAGRSWKGGPVPWKECICVTTLSPCLMCSGAILMYGIPTVVIGENDNYLSPGEALLRAQGVQVSVCNDADCITMMADWIASNPGVWNEDVAGNVDGARPRP